MADNPRYQVSGLGLQGVNITPAVQPIDKLADRVSVQALGAMSDMTARNARLSAIASNTATAVLDRMAASLYKDAAAQAEAEGAAWGAQNPVSVEQLAAAVAAGDDPLQSRFTHFGNAARKVQATVLGNQLNARGVEEMARIQAEVEMGITPIAAAAERMDAVSNAYTQTLAQVDGETAVKLRAALTTHSASVYQHLAAGEVKKYQAAQKAAVDEYFSKLPQTLEVIYLAGDQAGPDGVVKTADDLAMAQRAQAMQAARITGDPTYGKQFDKAQSEARVNAMTKVAMQPDFAGSATAALARMSSGNMGKWSLTWGAMPEDEKMKVREQYMKQKGQEYTAQERAEKDDKHERARTLAKLMSDFYLTDDPKKKRTIGREIAMINASGIGGPVYEPGTIKAFTKPQGDGDGESVTSRETYALTLIDRGGLTDINEIQKRSGVTGTALKRVQAHLYSKGDAYLNRQIKTMSSIPDGLVQMNGDQQRRFDLLNAEAEILQRKAIAEKGAYDPFTIAEELRKRKDEITREKAADADKRHLAEYWIGDKVFTFTPNTTDAEMEVMKIPPAHREQIKTIQARVRGK
jgi:hypothetical protein